MFSRAVAATWHLAWKSPTSTHMQLFRMCASLADCGWWADTAIATTSVALEYRGAASLPVRWVTLSGHFHPGDFHETQEKREKLCKMVTLILPISAVICVKDLNDWGTSEFFFRDSMLTSIVPWFSGGAGCPNTRGRDLKDESLSAFFWTKYFLWQWVPGLEWAGFLCGEE